MAERRSVTTFTYENSHISPGNLCVYEFQLPEGAIPGDKLEIQIEGFENMEFLFAFGTSITTARSKAYPENVGGMANPSLDATTWNDEEDDAEVEYEEIELPSLDASSWPQSPVNPED